MADVLLVEIGIALTGIAIAGTLANRIGLSVIPAYILVGILIGPNEPSSIAGIALTLVEEREFIDILAELGIIFLLFFLGLEFSVSQLLDDRTRIAKAGSIDFLVNFGLGVGLVFFSGIRSWRRSSSPGSSISRQVQSSRNRSSTMAGSRIRRVRPF